MSVAASVPNDADVLNPPDEVDDPAQIITSLVMIGLQLQKHAKQLGVHHLDDALPALQSQRLQHQQKPSIGCLQLNIKQSQFVLQEEDTLIGRSVKVHCQLYWLAVLCLLRSLYTRGPTPVRQHSKHFLVADTNQQVTLKQMEQIMEALTSTPCVSDNTSKRKGMMLLLIACLQ